MPHTIAKHRILFLIAIFMLLPATVFAAAAATTFIATSNGTPIFQVDLYDIDEPAPNAVTYKYAVTDLYNGSLPGVDRRGLSHWALGIGSCSVKSPRGDTYTTPIDATVCGSVYPNCSVETYRVEIGGDPTTGVNGIKFEGDTLDYNETHLFHITVVGETDRGDIGVAIKAGTDSYPGLIEGPICKPTAVTMAAPSIASNSNATFVAVAAAMMFMGVLSVGVLRKK